MTESNINIKVQLDSQKVPHHISWSASETSVDTPQNAKAMFLAFWDGIEKTALRIDLWTKEMTTDEMADFYYQLFVTLADTFDRATKRSDLSNEIKKFAVEFHKKYVAKEEIQR